MRTLLVSLALSVSMSAAAAPATKAFSLVTAAGKTGTLTVVEIPSLRGPLRGNAKVTDVTWNVDDNGRGSKLKEHVEVNARGVPVLWHIEGKGYFGAPVKEDFVSDGKTSTWSSLDDKGTSPTAGMYLPNNGTPWSQALLFRQLRAAKNNTLNVLPGGTARLEKLRDVDIGDGKMRERVTAYAVWGLDATPSFWLARNNDWMGSLWPGFVVIEDKHAGSFAALSALATELSNAAVEKLTATLTHQIEAPIWIQNVRVFDAVTGKRSQAQSVGVYRGVIVMVGNDAAPAGAHIIDGGGGTLLPGLLDAHAHVGAWDGPLDIAAGVTLARDPGNDNDQLLALEPRFNSGSVIGPHVMKSGFLEGKSPYSAHLGFVIDSVEEAKEKVRWYADHGYWGVKIYNSMKPDLVKAIAAEAHRRNLHVSGHVPAFMSSERAFADGYDEIHHINQLMLSFIIDPLKDDTRTPFRFTAVGERMAKLDLNSAPVQRIVKTMKEQEKALDPTMAIFSSLLMTRPGQASPGDAGWLDHMPVSVQRARSQLMLDIKPEQYATYAASWKKLEETLVMLHKEGITLVPGTDDQAGMMLHSELIAWVKAGIPASSVLQMATLGGARFLGMEQQRGTIAPGKRADLLLVDGDPTTDITTIRKGRLVMKDGVVFYPDEIHTALGIKPFAARAITTPPAR